MGKYIIFGAGFEGRNILNALGNERVSYFCDNKARGDVDGVPIIDFNQLLEIYKDFNVILGVQKKNAREQIGKQLEASGISYIFPSDAYELEEIDPVQVKYSSELDFWKSVNVVGQNRADTDANYKGKILSMAGQSDDTFLKDKVVADFGCGPRGSLNWLKDSAMNIGIDVLAPQYTNEFGREITKQRMIYVASGEKYIPIPDESIDCLITMNSLDHVSDLDAMCGEIIRIMKKGALLIGSFNLFEAATACEPQTLTEELLENVLFKKFEISSYRLSYIGQDNMYENILAGRYIENPDGTLPCILWVTATKK